MITQGVMFIILTCALTERVAHCNREFARRGHWSYFRPTRHLEIDKGEPRVNSSSRVPAIGAISVPLDIWK